MSTLHAALKFLGPVDFADVPSEDGPLDDYVGDLLAQSELILESIPITEPSAKDGPAAESHVATSASEIKASAARSATPAEEFTSLRKEWGKPLKLGAKENALGMSVYKMSAKDGRGAWFARRSVHEGLGFSKFKKSMQQEFEQSLATHGAPGEGNVRGIGGEERLERIDVPGRGTVEVYRLSAQFPGPTTPRDFVTLLVTSDTAMGAGAAAKSASQSGPRHYMIISKPCDHPKTQPQNDFVRGSYESVEFIREVPRTVKISKSTNNLDQMTKDAPDSISQAAAVLDAQQNSDPAASDTTKSHTRQRSVTAPHSSTHLPEDEDEDDNNPVEWIMVTRSDPGGSVPRFMVERGTPSSICADAIKFLDWACQQDFSSSNKLGKEQNEAGLNVPPALGGRRGSFQSFRSSRLAGLQDEGPISQKEVVNPNESVIASNPTSQGTASGGVIGALYGAASSLTAYTPQVVLDHLPGNTVASPETVPAGTTVQDDDQKSILSTTSFASAEDHISSSEDGSEAPTETSLKHNAAEQASSNPRIIQHEKELAKLEERRSALSAKFAQSREKLAKESQSQSARESAVQQKTIEKHEKEIKKHEEKYEKELKKIEERQQKEQKKLEERKRKELDKDEKSRLRRERDEARTELNLIKEEADVLRSVVEKLQKENTTLVAKLGILSDKNGAATGGALASVASEIQVENGGTSHVPRNRSSSSLRRLTLGSKDKDRERTMSNLSQSQELGETQARKSTSSSVGK